MTGQRVFICPCGQEPKLSGAAYGPRCKAKKEAIWRYQRLYNKGLIELDVMQAKIEAVENPQPKVERRVGPRGRPRKTLCPACRKNDKKPGQPYCENCIGSKAAAYYQERRKREGVDYEGGFSCASHKSVEDSLNRLFGAE